MKNKKGFTLVELLAVVALLAVLAAVATPAISSISRKSKVKMYQAKKKSIEAAAVMCVEKTGHIEDCDWVSELCDGGFLSRENAQNCAVNPINDLDMKNCVIEITQPNRRYSSKLTTYSYTSSGQKSYIESCKDQ